MRTRIVLLAMTLATTGTAKDCQNSTLEENEHAVLAIKLSELGDRPTQEVRYPGSNVPRDLSILNDDNRKRVEFINDQNLVVYQSHCPPTSDGSPCAQSMEAFFVNPQSGKLISRVTWPTIKRRWLNERWDTQARIFAVADGFVVHAGQSLSVYSTRLQKKAELTFKDGPKWAVTVVPGGQAIHLQRIEDDNQAEGAWLASDNLSALRSQHETAGITSASDHAVVDKLAHCVQLQSVGEAPQNVYCAEASHLGLPLFLTDSEILSVYYKGFDVRTVNGKKLWGREATKGSIRGDYRRSLRGNRFGILARGPVVFDGVRVSSKRSIIVVYDRASRAQIFHVILDNKAWFADFDLSPDARMLAVLQDEFIRLYNLPQ